MHRAGDLLHLVVQRQKKNFLLSLLQGMWVSPSEESRGSYLWPMWSEIRANKLLRIFKRGVPIADPFQLVLARYSARLFPLLLSFLIVFSNCVLLAVAETEEEITKKWTVCATPHPPSNTRSVFVL